MRVGLWPDKYARRIIVVVGRLLTERFLSCDGSFSEFCDTSREYTDISGVRSQSAPDAVSESV